MLLKKKASPDLEATFLLLKFKLYQLPHYERIRDHAYISQKNL